MKIPVRILWDMDSCGILKTYNAKRILGDFTQTVRNEGYEGTVDAYPVTRECGDVRPEHRSQLRDAGVKLHMTDCYGYTGKNATDNVIVELLSELEEQDNPALYVFVSCDSDYRVEIDHLLSTNQHVAVIHRRGRELQKGDQVFFLANGKLETEYADVLAQVNFTAGWPLGDDIDAGADGGMMNQPGTDGYLYLRVKLTEK